MNAAEEKKKLIETNGFAKVVGLPNIYDCETIISDIEDLEEHEVSSRTLVPTLCDDDCSLCSCFCLFAPPSGALGVRAVEPAGGQVSEEEQEEGGQVVEIVTVMMIAALR